MTPKKKPLENIGGKGENAGNQHFLLFPQCFLDQPTFDLSSANALNLVMSKNLSFGKELKSECTKLSTLLLPSYITKL